jgi:hypothetical protein
MGTASSQWTTPALGDASIEGVEVLPEPGEDGTLFEAVLERLAESGRR